MGASDSRIHFREHVVRLTQGAVEESDGEFWQGFWTLPASAEDVFAELQPEHVRLLLRAQPANLHSLLRRASALLRAQVDAPAHEAPERFAQTLNCVRTLTRLLPVLYHDAHGVAAVRSMCWGGVEGGSEADPGHAIIHAVMTLLVLPGFAVPGMPLQAQAQVPVRGPQDGEFGAVSADQLWCGGLGAGSLPAHRLRSFDRTRVELLRLLLALFSETLFVERAQDGLLAPLRGKFVACCTKAACPYAAEVFFSLLNTALSYDPVGWGLPYASVLAPDSARERLVDTSLHVLLLLLDDRPGGLGRAAESSSSDDDDGDDDNGGGGKGASASSTGTSSPPPDANVYRRLLSSISAAADLDVLVLAFSRLLNTIHRADSTVLPGSCRPAQCHHELLMLFWKLLECNKAFAECVLVRHDVTTIAFPVLYLMCCARREPSQAGLMHVCTFILLKLSGQRSFSVALNKPCNARLPGELPAFQGSHVDLLIITLELVISDGFSKLNSLSSCFLTIISNVSPYARALCFTTSVKLFQLLQRFAAPAFLYAAEQNHQHLLLLLSTLDNLVQYQFESNATLVFMVLANKETLQQIASLPPPTPKLPAAAASRQGGAAGSFTPTAQWAALWQRQLPLEAVTRLVDALAPQAAAFCTQRGVAFGRAAVVDFLRGTTAVGLLPVPHPIVIRKYAPNESTSAWLTTFIWGTVFLRSQLGDSDLPLFDSREIKLFAINSFEQQEQVNGHAAV